MNTKTILTSLVAAVIAFIAVLLIMLYALNYFLNRDDYSAFTTAEVSATNTPKTTQTVKITETPLINDTTNTEKIDFKKYNHYILKEYTGKIGIFAPDNIENPVSIIDVHVSSLPELDRQMLKLGITVDSKDELLMTIEDYSS